LPSIPARRGRKLRHHPRLWPNGPGVAPQAVQPR
jgi:hypothetical protein